jgi:transposase-like protein
VAIAEHQAGRCKRYSAALRERVVAYAEARRGEGASFAAIATDMGLSTETLRLWRRRARGPGETRAMVPVHVVEEHGAQVVSVVSTSGYRIEGLALPDAIAVLRALG